MTETETKDPKLQVRFVGPRKKYTFKNAIKQRAQRQKRIHIEKRPNNYELIQYKHHDKYLNIATIALQSKGLKEAHKVELHSSDIETAFKALLQRFKYGYTVVIQQDNWETVSLELSDAEREQIRKDIQEEATRLNTELVNSLTDFITVGVNRAIEETMNHGHIDGLKGNISIKAEMEKCREEIINKMTMIMEAESLTKEFIKKTFDEIREVVDNIEKLALERCKCN